MNDIVNIHEQYAIAVTNHFKNMNDANKFIEILASKWVEINIRNGISTIIDKSTENGEKSSIKTDINELVTLINNIKLEMQASFEIKKTNYTNLINNPI